MKPRSTAAASLVEGAAPAGALRSRLGRRFMLLFGVGALLPLVVFAGLSVTRVSQRLDAELQTTLHDAAKSSGMGVAARFAQVAGDLRLAADLVRTWRDGSVRAAGEALRGQLLEHCDAMWVVRRGRADALIGARALPTLDLSAAQEAHLAQGAPLVVVGGGGDAMLMLLQPAEAAFAQTRLIAHIRPSWFWDPQELRGESCEFAACGPSGQVLYHTFSTPPASEVLAASVSRRASSGALTWDVGGVPQLGRYWHAFLRPQYGVDLWMVQSRVQADAYAVTRAFERDFLLTAAGTLLCVVLLGLVTMRRTLDPIVSLRDATRRLGAGDLDARVDVTQTDEIGELGVAFNDMADRLRETVARRERTERELVASRDAALAAARAKAEFVTNVSHEFRTPMAEVLGAAEILSQDGEVEDAVREEFSKIALHGAERLANLLDDVLELDTGGVGARVRVDLGGTVRDAVASMPASIRARVTCVVEAELPAVWGDPAALTSCWRRLLDNAAKFSAPQDPIELRARTVAGALRVDVLDRGVGIAPADLEAVFEPFSQVGRDQLVEKARGTGLGLALVRATVEAHGGSVAAFSRRGVGSTFSVTLPAGALAPTPR